jgi:hypothetical protein
MARPQSGPPLIAPAVSVVVLTAVGVALSATAPRPDAPAADVLAYARDHATVMRWSAFLAFGASIPLAIWSATVYRRLRALGVTAPGSAIALAGGVLASAMAAMSGLVTWVGSRLDGGADLAAALRDLTFATGGPGYVAFLGLLIAGVSVPMFLLGINRPIGIFGLVVAACAQVSTLVLVTMNLAVTLPIGRFGGLIWLILASLVLPTSRPRTATPASSAAALP